MFAVFEVIAPFFLILALGFGYAKVVPLNLSTINVLNLRVFTPALIFSALTAKTIDFSSAGLLMLLTVAVVLGAGLLSWPVARICKLPQAPFTACMMFTNCGNMGLPLALLAFGETGFQLAVLIFVTENALHFSLGLTMYSGRWRIRTMINPCIIASVLALLSNYWHITLPDSIDFTIDLVGQICIPLMIFSLGVRLASADFKDWKVGMIGAVVCPISGVLIALLCIWLIPMAQIYQQALLLFSVLPPAAINLLMAERYNNQPEITASLVFVGNVASLAAVPILLLVSQWQ